MTTLWGWGRTQHRVWEKPKRTVPHHPTLAWESRGDKAYPRDPQPGSISGKTTLFGSVDCQTPELWTSHVYLHSSLKKVSEPLNTSMNCQRLATFGYDLCSLGVDGHQKNYHAGPDSLKILYCTRNHRNLQRQLRSRPVCLQKGTMAERKYQRKKVDTLLPFFNSKVEKGKYHVYNAQNWRKLGCLWFFFKTST